MPRSIGNDSRHAAGAGAGQIKQYKLLECRRQVEALSVVTQEKVDMVICEFIMPEMSGQVLPAVP